MKSLETFVVDQYSPKASYGYLRMINRYQTYMGDGASKAGYMDVLAYIGYLRKLGLHPKSLANHLFCIKIYYRYLNAIGDREDHPCQHLKLQDQINKKIPVESLYSRQTLDELLKHHKNKRALMQRRDEVLISLLIYQALSSQEIISLNTEDVNLKEGTIKAKGGYKQKPRTLSLQASQILLLHQYLTQDRAEILQKNPFLTQDVESALLLGDTGNRLSKGSINLLINKRKPNGERLQAIKIRQSVIKHLLQDKNDLRIVQVFAGHSRAGSTEEYKQTGLEELKTLIQKLHPLEGMF